VKDVIAKPIMLSNRSEPIIGRTFCAGTASSGMKSDSIKSPAGGGRIARGDMNRLEENREALALEYRLQSGFFGLDTRPD